MAHQSFAQTVLDAVKKAVESGGEVEVNDLSDLLQLKTRQEHKRMLNTMSDLTRSRRVVRVRQGVYAAPRSPGPADKREVMWRLIKMRRRVTLDDLMELAAVTREYAREWLGLLVRREVATKIQEPGSTRAIWVLRNDSAEMPVDDLKAERLRAIRKKNKGIVDKLKEAQSLLDQVCRELDEV